MMKLWKSLVRFPINGRLELLLNNLQVVSHGCRLVVTHAIYCKLNANSAQISSWNCRGLNNFIGLCWHIISPMHSWSHLIVVWKPCDTRRVSISSKVWIPIGLETSTYFQQRRISFCHYFGIRTTAVSSMDAFSWCTSLLSVRSHDPFSNMLFVSSYNLFQFWSFRKTSSNLVARDGDGSFLFVTFFEESCELVRLGSP